MSEIRVTSRMSFEGRVAEVLDATGLRVSETVTSDTLRVEQFGGSWIFRFEGAVFLSTEQMVALAKAGASEPEEVT